MNISIYTIVRVSATFTAVCWGLIMVAGDLGNWFGVLMDVSAAAGLLFSIWGPRT